MLGSLLPPPPAVSRGPAHTGLEEGRCAAGLPLSSSRALALLLVFSGTQKGAARQQLRQPGGRGAAGEALAGQRGWTSPPQLSWPHQAGPKGQENTFLGENRPQK